MKISTKDPISVLSIWMRLFGMMLMAVFMWPCTAVSQSSPASVNLGTSGDFVILSKTGISSTGVTSITGDIGVSPIDHTAITGFGLILDPSGTFSTSTLVTGKVYAADYTDPTPTKMSNAVSDMETAYTDVAGRTLPDYTELYAGDLTGQTLTPGLYKWGTGVLVSAGGVTISGTANDIWIFQIAQNLDLANGAIVTLSGGAQVSNIFWQVAGQVTLGTTVAMKGIILCQTQIVMSTSATLNGRALAQTAVTLDANTVFTSPFITSVEDGLAPQEFALFQNYPNPFNPSTKIKFALPAKMYLTLSVYNIIGKKITEIFKGEMDEGYHEAIFYASGLSSGVYFYKIESENFKSTKKMIFMK